MQNLNDLTSDGEAPMARTTTLVPEAKMPPTACPENTAAM